MPPFDDSFTAGGSKWRVTGRGTLAYANGLPVPERRARIILDALRRGLAGRDLLGRAFERYELGRALFLYEYPDLPYEARFCLSEDAPYAAEDPTPTPPQKHPPEQMKLFG